jgi:UDP-2-acetamido-2-deoxy-ribo-hexuluronate aminotransferase
MQRRHAHNRFGHDACMETLQCAIVLARLERFDWDIRQRRCIAAAYDEMLQPHLPVIGCRSDRTSACGGYAVLVEQREQVRAILEHAGVPTAVHYPMPIHRQPAYARLAADASCPVADAMASSLLSLPIGPHLAAANVRHAVQCLLHATGPLQARVVESVELQG